jgi:hypothetical protein
MWPFKKKETGLTVVSPEDDRYTDEDLNNLFNQINSAFETTGEAFLQQAKINAVIIEALDKAGIKINFPHRGPTRH